MVKSLLSFIRTAKLPLRRRHPQQQSREFLFLHARQHLMLSVFWIWSIPTGRGHALLFLTSLMPVKWSAFHLLFSIFISSLIKFPWRRLAHFFIGWFFSWVCSQWYIWELIKLRQHIFIWYDFCIDFLPKYDLFWHCLDRVLHRADLFYLNEC